MVNSPHSLQIHLIGAGGTGSQVLTALARINHSLKALGQAGFSLTLWDDDCITEANLGRQLFAASELGLYKSQASILEFYLIKSTFFRNTQQTCLNFFEELGDKP
ncbi:hypothetical protein C4H12_10060 [Capnocytophaga sp. oral taxon 878]|nr:hypothetical protein C4H12_10060 [Capnocytophaga sp. oral taxon 878]